MQISAGVSRLMFGVQPQSSHKTAYRFSNTADNAVDQVQFSASQNKPLEEAAQKLADHIIERLRVFVVNGVNDRADSDELFSDADINSMLEKEKYAKLAKEMGLDVSEENSANAPDLEDHLAVNEQKVKADQEFNDEIAAEYMPLFESPEKVAEFKERMIKVFMLDQNTSVEELDSFLAELQLLENQPTEAFNILSMIWVFNIK